MVLGIDHIDIRVPDVDAAVRFYQEALGLELMRRDENNGIMSTPDGVFLEISPGGTKDWDTTGFTYVLYIVDSVDAALKRAFLAGAAAMLLPHEGLKGNGRTAFARAPSGEAIGFCGNGSQSVGTGTVKRFLQVGLAVPDVLASTGFYEELGAKTVRSEENCAIMEFADGRQLALYPSGETAGEPKAYSHLSLLTDNVDRALGRVVWMGGKIGHEPYDWSNLRIAFASGLGGEVIEFFYFYQDGRKPDILSGLPYP